MIQIRLKAAAAGDLGLQRVHRFRLQLASGRHSRGSAGGGAGRCVLHQLELGHALLPPLAVTTPARAGIRACDRPWRDSARQVLADASCRSPRRCSGPDGGTGLRGSGRAGRSGARHVRADSQHRFVARHRSCNSLQMRYIIAPFAPARTLILQPLGKDGPDAVMGPQVLARTRTDRR